MDNLRVRELQVRYMGTVEAIVAGNAGAWEAVIAELDSDLGAYTCTARSSPGA